MIFFVTTTAFVALVGAAPPTATPQRSHQTSPAPSVVPSLGPPSTVPSPQISPAAASFDLGVWTVHASSIDANFKSGNFSTAAKVVMTRVGGDVTADRANGNYKKQLLYLNGHVVMHDMQGNYGGLAPGASPQPGNPSTLTADRAQIDGAAKVYKAVGNVHYVQGPTVVDADTGTLNNATHDLLLEGRVHVVDGARSMLAQRVIYNTITGTAHAEGDVTLEFPSELHRHLATPKPLRVPKNSITQPVVSSAPR